MSVAALVLTALIVRIIAVTILCRHEGFSGFIPLFALPLAAVLAVTLRHKDRDGVVNDSDAQALRPGNKAPWRPRLRATGCNAEPVPAGPFCLGAVNVCNGTESRAGVSLRFSPPDSFAPGGTHYTAFGNRISEGVPFARLFDSGGCEQALAACVLLS